MEMRPASGRERLASLADAEPNFGSKSQIGWMHEQEHIFGRIGPGTAAGSACVSGMIRTAPGLSE